MNKGLTLIELLVSMTMLSLTITGVVSIFTATVSGQERSLASQEMLDQSSYVVEYMSRILRMAKKDTEGACLGDVTLNYLKSGSTIRFLSYHDQCYEFRLDPATNKLQERKSSDNNEANFPDYWTDLTSDELQVLSFIIGSDDSWDENDDLQPRITLFFEIKGNRAGLKPEEQPLLNLQTTVSQRNLDVVY